MTLSAQIVSDLAEVFLVTDDFAEVITRYAGGDSASRTSVTAVVTWMPTVIDDSRGRGYVRRGELLIADTVTVTAADAFMIGANRCEVLSIDAPQYGSRVVHVQRYEPDQKGVKKAGDV